MATNVYIDGFNLYYGSLKTRLPQYKWLDIQSFCESLLPNSDVRRVRYFTARVRNSPRNDQIEMRQQTYLRALMTLPKVSIHYGHFRDSVVRLPLANPADGGAAVVEVIRTEEKRSDVNLATHLLIDACHRDFHEAVVISNDSDLVEPIQAVRDTFGLRIGVINTGSRRRQSHFLIEAASWTYASINHRHFRDNQLPGTILDGTGEFGKPPSW